MKRAILALLATVAGLTFIFTFRPVSVTADPTATTIIVPQEPGNPGKPGKFGEPEKFGKKGGKGLVEYDLAGRELATSGLADGVHTGDPVQIPGGHGLLQVSVTVAGGVIVDIVAAHEPTSTHSAVISGGALPVLREEVLTTQQAPVDAVSGATAVSQAFGESLLSITG